MLSATASKPPFPRPASAKLPATTAAAGAGPQAAGGLDYGWLKTHLSAGPQVAAPAGILVDLDTNRVLWSRDDFSEFAPASLTKMMTAMVAADHSVAAQVVTVPAAAVAVEPSLMNLSAGERVTVRELLYGLFLNSGNDAAETLARTLMPRERFLALMNQKAVELGLHHTHFSNPTGLDDPGLYASAHDLALIGIHLVHNYPLLVQIAGTSREFFPATQAHKAYALANLNPILGTYSGASGLKTGFTDNAANCIVATATRGGRHLLAVVLHTYGLAVEAGTVLDYGFALSS